MAMKAISYKQPPITEAVIEISFTEPHNKSKIKKFINRHKGAYSDYHELNHYRLDINIPSPQDSPKAEAIPQLVHRFSSQDMTQQLLLNESSVIVSQLAPYCGWKDFIERFIRDWRVWKKHMGFNEIKQIGVRYINRLDIPVSGPVINFSEYVNINLISPESLGHNSSYAIHVKFPINELKSTLTLNTAVVQSPLLNCMSLVIDQDIVRAVELPQKDDSIYGFLDEVHEKKNSVFESCITNKAREIFNT